MDLRDGRAQDPEMEGIPTDVTDDKSDMTDATSVVTAAP